MKTGKLKLVLYGVILASFVGVYSCSTTDVVPAVDKVALGAAVSAARTLHDGSLEGVATGNYLKGSKAVFQTAITAAEAVVLNASTTQVQVTAATASLADASTVFAGKLVTPIDPTNLVGHWTFDEVTTVTPNTVVKDYSGNLRNGSIKVGHAFWGAGAIALAADRNGTAGKALRFNNGANVEIPYSTALNPATMSISIWAKPDVQTPTPQNNQYFISMNRWNGWKFNFQDTPRAFFTCTYDNPPAVNQCCYDRDQNVGTSPQGAWHHYVVTFGGGKETFYIDGILVFEWTNTPGTISLLTAPINLVLGQDLPTNIYVTTPDTSPFYVNYGGYYIGLLDEVRMYKSVLTAAQVTSIYNVEKP